MSGWCRVAGWWKLQVVLLLAPVLEAGQHWPELSSLHPQHLAFYLSSNPEVAAECRHSTTCPYKMHLDRGVCWGYEEGCGGNRAYSQPSCPGDARGWVHSKKDQIETFYKQADFGYVREQRQELKVYCEAQQQGDSQLECSDHMRFCRGTNIYIDFRPLVHRKEVVHYHTDVLQHGQVGGHCRLNQRLLDTNADQISALQSWGPELRHFTQRQQRVEQHSQQCDLWVHTPTFITKIDATVNMYHHFCDFFNLYAAQHVNNSHRAAFSHNNQILIWETLQYRSNFGAVYEAFTSNPLWNLNHVAGKRVCFKDVVFPLLPRMIFGLFYNTPVVWGCEKSGLFHSFSHHLLHRLAIPQRSTGDNRIHITLLSRETKFRRILNEAQLIKTLQKNKNYIVRKAEYSHQTDFRLQLRQDQWTDVFIGMHGAGLTHLLFLPDWAVVFELYNCGDANCYQDLARLRGVKYMTWEDPTKVTPQDEGTHPDGGAHEKFTNYKFNVGEFVRLVEKAAEHVRGHRGWQNLQEELRAARTTHDEL